MSAWVTIPCLLALRDEFNVVSPKRDKGADGTIGDQSHTSSSDHTPDEDSDVLDSRDADSKNEVHALDIDSSGPWPDAEWFNREILALVAREKKEYESPTILGRLQYVIWNKRIASRSWGWTWQAYNGADPHTNHAHFSARYLTSTENDTRPWGIEASVALTADDKKWLQAEIDKAATNAAARVWATKFNIEMDAAKPAYNAEAGSIVKHIPSEHGQFATLSGELARITTALNVLIDHLDDPQGPTPVTREMLIDALRAVLRDGVNE